MQRSLRGVAPTLEVFTNRSNRHEKTTALADQFSHRITRPERKAELELVGHLIGHQGANQHFLAGAQTAAITLAHTTLAAGNGSLFAFMFCDLRPVSNSAGVNTNRFANSLRCNPAHACVGPWSAFHVVLGG